MKYFKIRGEGGDPSAVSVINIQRDPSYPPELVSVDTCIDYWSTGDNIDEALKRIPQAFPIRKYEEITEQQYIDAWRKTSRGRI
jgi:hypothetical protein